VRFGGTYSWLIAAGALALAPPCLEAQRIPWVLPWNDASPALTDLSGLNASIGSERVSVDTNGHFVVGGQRVRFLGVNFAGDSPFMPTSSAEAVAARLAKFGINAVRFHHMDAPWASNGGVIAYTSTKSTNINAAQLDRVHYLVSRLKAHGIYADINLLVGREYRSGDGLGAEVTGMDWKDTHTLGFFYPPALALHKDYATKLLAATNRYTGLPLAKDPAVALVEIINENGVIQKWFDGGLDQLPARYATNLQARWNDWLLARYTNDAAMLAAWRVVDQPLGANLLKNGAFSNSLVSWNLEQHGAARATFIRTLDFTNGGPAAKVAVTAADQVGWYIQLNQAGLLLSSTQAYTVSFWAKSSPATNAEAAIMRAYGDYAGLGYGQALALTTNWQQFSASFIPSESESNARINFGGMGDKLATFWYADVRLQPGGLVGALPGGASLATRTVPNLRFSGSGYTGTPDARRDWLRFLRELEYAYYDAMVAHLRDKVGYGGLVFGTIMANSPASVQSRLDVIDGHAYWQHPQFPGEPWDPANWLQPNISMVNTVADDNTLALLARQRIKGKPFTVTEYQHPSPNYYGGEGPLLAAAYGGLQDWDGLWIFDYGPGNDVVPMGCVRSYFDTAQHPTKMPNLLLAANLFRRGDAQPASREYTMALTPERELDLLESAGAWGVFSIGQLGVSGRLAFTSRLDANVGANPAGLTNPPTAPGGNILYSDTLQLRWNLSRTDRGLVTIDTPRTKALVGFADNQSVTFGGITLRPGTTQLGWCTLGITLVSGEVFTNDCSALVVATGWYENTGQKWNSASNSVSTNWGRAPVLTEVVPFTLGLPVGTNYVSAWSLDERGQRKAALPVTGSATATTLTIGTNAASIWYEVSVSRWMASFDLWRLRYFTAAELADPAISGPAAAPDGDGVPNLWRYYLGLARRAPVPAELVPFASLLRVGGPSFLALTYTHDKLAGDVSCVGEVSPDLAQWLEGPAYTCVEQTTDLGPLQQVTIRDLTPVAAAPQHFLRLRLQWP